MSSILLINPPNEGDAYRTIFGFISPPLGLCSIAAILRERGHKVKILDLNSLTESYSIREVLVLLKNTVKMFKPEYVGVSITATCTAPVSSTIAKIIKEIDNEIVCIAGGHHATFMPRETLNNGFDYVVKNEGEITITELIDTLESGGNPSKVKGIAYVKDNKYIETQNREFIENLDQLPIPARDLLDKKKYFLKAFGRDSSVTTAETSRGCPFSCDFCSASPMWGRRWRVKSRERILYELKEIRRDNWKYVFFVDDNFITPLNIEDRRRLFLDVIREGIDIQWICQIRADTVVKYPDLMRLAARAGMKVAFIGVESGDEEVLKKMHKGFIPKVSEKAVSILRKIGVATLAGFIIGAPYESLKQTYKTIKFALNLCKKGLDAAQFGIYTPLPGSRAFIEAVHNKLLATKNWILYDCLHPVLRKNRLTLYFLMRWSHYIFYLYKWIYGIVAVEKLQQPFIAQAKKYLVMSLPRHLKGFINLPIDTLRMIRMMKSKQYIF